VALRDGDLHAQGRFSDTADDMRAMAEALDKIKGSLVAGYVAKSGGAEDDIAALMARETWLDAAEAVEFGFADRLAEPVRIAARFDVGRFRNAPPALIEAIDADGDAASDDAPEPAAAAVDDAARDAAAAEDEADPAPPEGVDDGTVSPGPTAVAPDPAVIRAEVLAHASAVIDLCALAGLPLQARRFLEAGASLDEVRAALLAARADATPEVTALHPQPGRPSGAQPWGEVIARTFKPKG
jgi:hypothetical protein